MNRRALAMLAIGFIGAACGDDVHPTDPRLTGACLVTFGGNFDETSADPANCPAIETSGDRHVSLVFAIRSVALSDTMSISIDLGIAPRPGRYASPNAAPWSVLGLRGGCVFSAGDTSVPPGSYALDFDGTHGSLDIVQHVLATPGSDCGPGDLETIAIEF